MRMLMYQVTKELWLECGHKLTGLPEGHKCTRDHGHSYRVVVTLAANALDATGFIIDFGIIKDVLVRKYDHYVLNDVIPKKNPTVEVFAEQIMRDIMDLIFQLDEQDRVSCLRVKVWETRSSSAAVTLVETEDP